MTVTFLLTDVEASTRLWERDWDGMAGAMHHHESVVADVVARHRGRLHKHQGEGDSAFAVFDDAADAVAAAAELQLRFQCEPWPGEVKLRVRAALHSGEAIDVAGEFVGPAVNRCARLRSLAHGGQTLVSGTTAALVDGPLAEGVRLTELGTYTLRDLTEPEAVFQLDHERLPATFPPLRAARPGLAHLRALIEEIDVDLARLPVGVPTMALSGHIELADGPRRAAFLEDVKGMFEPLVARYSDGDGPVYRIAFTCYPIPTTEEN